MMLKNYLNQHEKIKESVARINILAKDDLGKNAFEIATQINPLAGTLKIHLDAEDKYLNPSLANKEDEKIRGMSLCYQKEMGSTHEEFISFKEKHNTKAKLLAGEKTFSVEWKAIVNALEKRMEKEENEIYQFIS